MPVNASYGVVFLTVLTLVIFGGLLIGVPAWLLILTGDNGWPWYVNLLVRTVALLWFTGMLALAFWCTGHSPASS